MLLNTILNLLQLKQNIYSDRKIDIVKLLLFILFVSTTHSSALGQTSLYFKAGEYEPSEYDYSAVCDFMNLRRFEMAAIEKQAARSRIIRLLPKYEEDNYGEFRYVFDNRNNHYSYFDYTINQRSGEFILEFAQYTNYSGFLGIYREKSMIFARFGIIEMNKSNIIRLPCDGFIMNLFFESEDNLVYYINKFTFFRVYRG